MSTKSLSRRASNKKITPTKSLRVAHYSAQHSYSNPFIKSNQTDPGLIYLTSQTINKNTNIEQRITKEDNLNEMI